MPSSFPVSLFSVTIINTQDNLFVNRKDLFWLCLEDTYSPWSIYPMVWKLKERQWVMPRSVWQSKTIHWMAQKQRLGGKVTGVPKTHQGHNSNDLKTSHLVSTLKGSIAPQLAPHGGHSVQCLSGATYKIQTRKHLFSHLTSSWIGWLSMLLLWCDALYKKGYWWLAFFMLGHIPSSQTLNRCPIIKKWSFKVYNFLTA